MENKFSDRIQKKIIVYSALSILFIGVIIALISIIPLYHDLKEGRQENLLMAVKSKGMAIEEYLSRCKDVAGQISGRTAIRERLRFFTRGEMDLGSFQQMVRPALNDSLIHSVNLAGITLVGFQANPLVKVGLSIPREYWPKLEEFSTRIINRGVITIADNHYLLIEAPIFDPTHTHWLGTDLVLFELTPLKAIIGNHNSLGKKGEVLLGLHEGREARILFQSRTEPKAPTKGLSLNTTLVTAFEKAFQNQTGILSSPFSKSHPEILAYGPIPDTKWGLVVKMDRQELFASLKNQIIVIAGIILVLILLGSLGMIFLLRPLTGKIIIHTDELNRQIQDKTLALETELNERQKAEESLKKERQRLFSLLDGLPASVYLQAPDYTIRYANRYFFDNFGSPEGKYCYQIFHGLQQPCRECPTFEVFETHQPHIWKSKRVGGQVLQIYNFPFPDWDGSPLVLEMGIDISELNKKERELKDSRNLLDKTLSSLNEAVFIVDPKTRRIWDCNKTAEDLFGYSKEAILAQPDTHFLYASKQQSEDFHQEALKCYEAKGFFKTEYTMKRNNGELFPTSNLVRTIYDESGRSEKAVFVVRDITERKENEAALNRLATAIDQAAESILITDVQGVIKYANPAFEKISGFNRVEVLEKDMRTLNGHQQDQASYKKIRENLRQGKTWKGHLHKIKKGGSAYEVDVTISPVRDTQGNLINLVEIERDVTHERQLENQLRQAQKMEAIGTLAGGIAHDFNNILTAILGYTEISLHKEPMNTVLKNNLEQVHKAGIRAKDLVNQILTFSRQKEKEVKPIQPAVIVKEVLKLLRASLPSTIEIRQNLPNGNEWILADPTQFHQIIMNLCTNAAQAMTPQGGLLEVGLEEIPSATQEGNSPLEPGLEAFLKLTVKDTGRGIDPSLKEKIFDPFFTTKGVGEGTGLGLSVVHGIVNNLGGRIWVDSEPGEGSSFQVLFPLIEVATPQETQRPNTPMTGQGRILFVDDEEAIVDMSKQMLEHLGYEVTIKTNSHEALNLFNAKPWFFDLIITDLTMPFMSGIKLAKEISTIRPDIPIILSTGFSAGITLEQARKSGIRELVFKPIIQSEIARVIQKVLGNRSTADSSLEALLVNQIRLDLPRKFRSREIGTNR